MCIRDRSSWSAWNSGATPPGEPEGPPSFVHADVHYYESNPKDPNKIYICLLYTSDAADERSSVDLGGRRIIKKKTTVANGADRGRNLETSK